MTSKNSFLTSLRENNKRRLWVWIISALSQLFLYVGVLVVYLSRIRSYYRNDYYSSAAEFKKALCDASMDALGFSERAPLIVLLLGAFIGLQGFSYLYERKKIDMYCSVPVSAKRRFGVIYLNGVLAYIIPCIISVGLGVLIAAAQGALDSKGLAACGLAFILNFVYFIAVYNTTILALMLTGQILVSIAALGVLLFIGYLFYALFEGLKNTFFMNASSFFYEGIGASAFSIVSRHMYSMNAFTMAESFAFLAGQAGTLLIEYLIYALIVGLLAYLCYRKRPMEAAGRAIAFNFIKPFVKIVISVALSLSLFEILYSSSDSNMTLGVCGALLGALLGAAVMEIIFESELRAAIKHPVTGIASVVIAITVICIYYFDIFAYDAYVPETSDVESIALWLSCDGGDYYDWAGTDVYIEPSQYLKENMFITDVSPVLELAKKARGVEENDMEDVRNIFVLYRLKSGREVSRRFSVDFADASNAPLLDAIVGSGEYKEGAYQIVKDDSVIKNRKLKISYKSGTVSCAVAKSEGARLREAWIKDMEDFNFSMGRNNLPCGYISLANSASYYELRLPVYESFAETIAVLKDNDAYYPYTPRSEDILSVQVIHYDNREKYEMDAYGVDEEIAVADYEAEDVTAEFYDIEEISGIVEHIYPHDISCNWIGDEMIDYDYSVLILYNNLADYPYEDGYIYYYFKKGEVPDFVMERTALGNETRAE